MAGYISDDTRKVTTHRLVEMKQRGEKISMLTSYDYTMAQIVDGAGMDVILVGDSASNDIPSLFPVPTFTHEMIVFVQFYQSICLYGKITLFIDVFCPSDPHANRIVTSH